MKTNFQKIPLLFLIVVFGLSFILSVNNISEAKTYNQIAQAPAPIDIPPPDEVGMPSFPDETGGETAAEPIGSGGYLFTEEDNPLKSKTILQFLNNLFDAIQPIVLLLAVFFIIISGFQFVKAQGEPAKIKTAQDNIKWTLVGVAIITGAKFLIDVISDLLVGL